MTRFRLSQPAEADLARILATGTEQWGADAGHRYALLLGTAMRKVAADPHGAATRERPELQAGIRSLHIRHARATVPDAPVRSPVHVLYYRAIAPDMIEIVRVLHERMEPSRHIGTGDVD
jgi:toxin ParE1/3/4